LFQVCNWRTLHKDDSKDNNNLMSSRSAIFCCYDWKCLYFPQLFSPCTLNTYAHQSVIMASQVNEGTSGSKDGGGGGANKHTHTHIHSTVTDKEIFSKVLQQGWRNPGCEVTWATKFCMVAPKFVGPQYETWLMTPF